MPPEPLPWDRKDFFKERKHDRSEALGAVARWRDSHHGSREFVRWGSDEFRRPQGHGKQGGYPLCSEESGYGCTLSRSSERMVDDEICRPSASRAEGKYGRNNRENKGSFCQKEGKWHPLDTGDASAISSGRKHDLSSQRSVDDLPSHAHSDIENSSWDQLDYKDQHDKMGSVDDLGTDRRYNKDHSLGSITWKALKWTRSSSLSSRGSSFSHSSSSSRSIKADSDESKPDLLPGKASPVQLSSRGADAGVTSASPLEDSCPRKKQRLGWGQGLAKYEKKNFEGPEETINKSGFVSSSNSTKATHGLVPTLSDKSPRVIGLSECASPATPSSVGCSSSPGVEDKPCNKAVNIDNDNINFSYSPGHGFQNSLEEFSVSLENLELNPLNDLGSPLADLLQSEDASSGDSCFVRSTVMNKLLLLKNDISKALEKTECEIDLFENELKLLNSEIETCGSCPTALMSLQVNCASKPCEEVYDVSKVFLKPAPLQVVSSGNFLVDKPSLCNGSLEEICAEVKDEDFYSPGTASSKFVDPLNSFSVMVKHEEFSTDLDGARSTAYAVQCSDVKKSAGVSGTGSVNDLIECSACDHVSSNWSLHGDTECGLYASVLASNKDTAKKNSEVFNKLLPTNRQIDTWGGSSVSYLQNNFLIKEKLAMRKCFVRFKERVLTLKFRAFQHLWKEDMRLLSMRKHRPKAQKRIELSSRTSHAGYQKHRSSIRARFTLPAGNLTLVPTTEVVDFAGKLLLDSRIKLYRNSLKMPALILDEKEKRLSRFVTRNGLIEDPCSVEQERSMINPWTSKEKEIFLETLATFGKNFKKIASFLEHKTIADCIQFYYKNQKSECFENVKKKLDVKKQGRSFLTNTYLVTSGKKWSREANSASLDMLGAVSVIAAHADESLNTHHTSGKKKFLAGPRGYKTFCGDDAVLEPSSCVDILGNEKEAVAADVLAGICGALSSEAMCSCVTSSVGLGEGCPERKCQKVNINDRPSTSEVMQNVDDEETCSGESCGELDSGDWTDDEKSIFIRALRSYGKDFAIISRCVGTRSRDQCKIFFSKARKCLGLDVLHLGPGNEGMPVSGTNGGRSDTEDACVVETDSVICSTQSSSKMDVNLPFSVTNTGVGAFEHAGTTDMTDLEGSGEKNCMVPLDCEDTERGISSVFLNDCQAGVKTALVFDGGNNFAERVGNIGATPEVLQGNDVKVDSTLNSDEIRVLHGSAVLPGDKETGKEEAIQQTISPTKESVSTGGPREPDLSRSNAAVELQIVPGATAEELKTDSEGRKPTVPEKGLGDGQCANSWVNTNSKTSSSCCVAPDSNACGNGIVSAADNGVHTGFSLTANYQRQISLELLPSIQKSQIISWQQQNCPVPASLVLQNASAVHFEDPLRQAKSSTTLKFDELGNKKHQESANVDVCQQYLLGHHPLSTVESSQVLRGYPLRVLNKKEIDGESDSKSGKKSAVLQSFSKINRNSQSNQCFVQDLYYDKCNGSTLPNSVAELPLLLKSQEQSTSDHPRPHFRSSSDTEENLRRTGDVKLFGQILSHPSLLQKPNPPSHESDDNGMSKPSGKSFNLKCTPDQGTVRTSAKAKLDPINCSGVEEIPTRSYGFWDGSRIQTGLSSPPDSALLLAKYPAVFRDYSTSSCRVEQQPLPAVTRSDRNLGSISVFPTKDVSDPGGLTDYQVYRSYDGTKVQPFTVDVKQQDIFSELQKRSKGLEALSGFQQQGRVVGMKGGGILVGGSCTGVSDPVAAIKMHYATTERYGGQAGSIREGESWRGDIGR